MSKQERDSDDQELWEAMCDDWPDDSECERRLIASLTRQNTLWRGRALYWKGRAKGLEDMVAHLAYRIKVLEEREKS